MNRLLRNPISKILYCLIFLMPLAAATQDGPRFKPLIFDLSEDGKQFVRITGLNQVWLRHTWMNPGTTINGVPIDRYTDISIRRMRFTIQAQLTDRVYFYTQFGINNFNHLSTKFEGAFFHDGVVEYRVSEGNQLYLGGGLTAWTGLSRYSTPSIGTILGLDVPLYQQALGNTTDQFLRNLAVYAKGQLGRLDYRAAMASPIDFPEGDIPQPGTYQLDRAPNNLRFHSYTKYMFKDIEGNRNPYQAGTYLGNRSVFNLGVGLTYHKDGVYTLSNTGSKVEDDLLLLAADIFYDDRIGEDLVLTSYIALNWYDFGDNYLRNVGVDNPANGQQFSRNEIVGFGNSIPLIGTGTVLYSQVGLLFGHDILSEGGKLQPYLTALNGNYERLGEPLWVFEYGLNYLINGTHNNKLSVMYQDRPVYDSDEGYTITDRRGSLVLQYQVTF